MGVLEEPWELLKRLEKEPGVVQAEVLVAGPVMAKCRGLITTPFIRGVDEASSRRPMLVRDSLTAGEWLVGPDSLVVGEEWARRNQAWVGDVVSIYSPKNLQDRLADFPGEEEEDRGRNLFLPVDFVITGIYRTGFYEFDANYVFMQLEPAQELYGLGTAVHAIVLTVEDPMAVLAMEQRIGPTLPEGIRIRSWMRSHRTLLEAVVMERRVMWIIVSLVLVVSAFGLCSTLIVITVQKRRAIGTMIAMGATVAQVGGVFTCFGLIAGVMGSVAGVGGALLTLRYLNEISAFLSQVLHQDLFPPDVYHFSGIPVSMDPLLVLTVAASALVVSVGAALVPAWMATRVQPSMALRNE